MPDIESLSTNPPLPYKPGAKIQISTHTPPAAYGGQYKNHDTVRKRVRGIVDEFGQPQVDHVSFVLSNPPVETAAAPDSKSHVLILDRIISHTPTEQGGGAFVVSCHLDSRESCLYVAKIYDGLGYRLSEPEDGWSDGFDCMYLADMHYGCEAAAYQNIPSRFQGDIVPRYHGSWTFSLPVGSGSGSVRLRPVRMILIEHIEGQSMRQMILGAMRDMPDSSGRRTDYSLLPPEEQRLEVLGRLIEAEMTIWWYAGVRHNDVSPRNVMVSTETPGAPLRVVLIDFNLAHVLKLSEEGQRSLARLRWQPGTLPPSPIQCYWPGPFTCESSFGGWVPESWCVNRDDSNGENSGNDRALDWLVSRFKDSPNYRPLSEAFVRVRSMNYDRLTARKRHYLDMFKAELLAAKKAAR